MRRTVTYLNIPSFPVAIERIKDPALRSRPIAIAPLNSERSKLWAVSAEARESGVFKGIHTAQAKRLCRDLTIIPPNPDLYLRANEKLFQHLSKQVHLFEFERQGKVFLDLTGYQRLYGPGADFGMRLQKQLRNDFHLECSIGVAKNKLVAKIAAKDVSEHRDIQLIDYGEERQFLSPFPNQVLPVVRTIKETRHGLSADIFRELNLHTVKDLSCLDKFHLQVAFGPHAPTVFSMSRGIDHRSISPPVRRPSIFEERHLDEETNHFPSLMSYWYQLLERACFRLRLMNKVASQLRLGIRYSDFKYLETTKKFTQPFQDSQQLDSVVEKLFRSLFYRRTSLRYLCLECSSLEAQILQPSLFNEHNQKNQQMETIDSIKKRFGLQAIRWGKEAP